MNIPLFWLSIGLGLGASLASNAASPEYRCEAGTVANDAILIARADVSVGSFSDPNDKVCTFSVDGRSTTEADQQPLSEAIDRLMQNDLEGIVIYLTIPRSEVRPEESDTIRDTIAKFLYENELSGELISCFDALKLFDGDGSIEPSYFIDDREGVYMSQEGSHFYISCSILAPGDDARLNSDVPTLLLNLQEYSGEANRLFVPRPALNE